MAIALSLSLFAECFTQNGLSINTQTNLMWAPIDAAQPNGGYTECLVISDENYGGYSDWRFPNINELMTIRYDINDGANQCLFQGNYDIGSSTYDVDPSVGIPSIFYLSRSGRVMNDGSELMPTMCVRDIK